MRWVLDFGHFRKIRLTIQTIGCHFPLYTGKIYVTVTLSCFHFSIKFVNRLNCFLLGKLTLVSQDDGSSYIHQQDESTVASSSAEPIPGDIDGEIHYPPMGFGKHKPKILLIGLKR